MEDHRAQSGDSVPQYLIAAYVDSLQSAFTVLKQRLRPDFRGVGNHEPERWEACARLLHAAGLDPFAFMQFSFDTFAAFSHDVFPRMVLSPNMVERFKEEAPAREEKIELICRIQAEYLKRALDSGSTLEEELLNKNTTYSALFRFAVAWSQKKYELASRFRADAQRMLTFEPLYKKFLGKWLPEEMLNG